MKPECEMYQSRLVVEPSTPIHDAGCLDCASFRALERELSPPEGLTARTLSLIAPVLRRRRALRRRVVLRLALAGALSLPVLVALNGLLLWSAYALGSRVMSPEANAVATTVAGASLLLFLSLAYGSLPILASWGLRHRERIA